MKKVAKQLIAAGLSVTATNKNKVSLGSWTELQKRFLSDDEIDQRFESAHGIAIIAGKISGGLEIVDVDLKYDATGTLYESFIELIPKTIVKKIVIASTVSGGFHVYYRCDTIEGNKKLALREATADEKKENPHLKVFVLIETRGEGGYVIAPPTLGYTWVKGDFSKISKITSEEREIILNAAKSLNEYFEEPKKEPHVVQNVNYATSPFEDFNNRGDTLALLQKHGWKVFHESRGRSRVRRPGREDGTSGDYLHEKKWLCLFSSSTEFETGRAYKPSAVFCKLECNDDWSECAKKLKGLGYGIERKKIDFTIEKIIREAKGKNSSDEDIIDTLIQKKNISTSKAKEYLNDFIANEGTKILKFWFPIVNKKDSVVRAGIAHEKLIDFMFNDGGFQLFFHNKAEKDFKLIRIKNGLAEDSTVEDIKKFVFEYIESLPDSFDEGITRQELKQTIIRGNTAYFSAGMIEFLPRCNREFLTDTKNECFIPFKNGVVLIKKDNIRLISFSEIYKVIWKRQLIDFQINIESLPSFNGKGRCEFEQFLLNINGNEIERTEACATTIGYLLHKYKDPTKSFAIILSEETENENLGGGTGKGIFVTALSKLTTVEQVDGKNFKIDKNFAFQRVKIDTRILAIQDVRQKVDFEAFYSLITEGITVEKKNKDEMFIRYQESPKIIFTTNYSIPANGNHAKRRQKTIPFSSHYHPGFSPYDEFGHQLFDEWNEFEWNAFFNFMFSAIQAYLEVGIKEIPVTKQMKLKQIKMQFTEDFRDWFTSFMDDQQPQWTELRNIYTSFVESYTIDTKQFTNRKFKQALQTSCELLGYICEFKVIREFGNRVCVRFQK